MPSGRQKGQIPTKIAKARFLKHIANGVSRQDACKRVGRKYETVYHWRYQDADFKKRWVEAERALTGDSEPQQFGGVVPDFPTFRKEFLGQQTWPHQLQWFDLLEGREPRDVHPSMLYRSGRDSRIIVNTPPNHAKSTTITSDYVVWRIVRDPSVRVIIVSKAQRLAEQFLLQIKERLTSPQYQRLIDQFAPVGGYDSDSAGWSASRFYVSSKVRGAEAKDPTVQALGVGGQIYGARADLIILDDVADSINSHDFDKQIQWMLTMAASRLAPRTGRLLVIGTRIASRDIYSELQEGSRYHGGKSPWTYFSQPAVLEAADDPKDWVTLWPKTDVANDSDEQPDQDGLYPRWDGPTLAEVRASMPTSEWSRMYQQEQISEDSIFKPEEVTACTGAYPAGKLIDDKNLGRDTGTAGLRLVMGLDPAAVGYTGAVLIGLDRATTHRWVIDIHNEAAMTPDRMRALIRRWVVEHGVHEIRIEGNAFQKFLALDREIGDFCASRGVVIHEHHTGSNKHDPAFGVAAMTNLFKQQLITLPRQDTERSRALVEQLLTWDPQFAQSKKARSGHKTDLVMALWFAELRCQELTAGAGGQQHSKSPFQSRWDRKTQRIAPVFDAFGSNQNDTYTPMWK